MPDIKKNIKKDYNAESIKVLKGLEVDILIHNAAVVGTDVVGLDPAGATSTNVTGTYSLIRVANSLNIPIIYLGTTVIYDTAKYQDENIEEGNIVKEIQPGYMYGNRLLRPSFVAVSKKKAHKDNKKKD